MASTVIPVYLAQLLDKLKAMAPQTTTPILSKEEAEKAGQPQAIQGQPNYPARPQITAIPDKTQFEATPYRSSVGLATAGLVAQKNANIEAANQAAEQQAWFEKMKDASDIYKTDRAIEKQSQAEEGRMKRLMEAGKQKAELEGTKQEGRKELIGMRGEQAQTLQGMKGEQQMKLLEARNKMKMDMDALKTPSESEAYRKTFNEVMSQKYGDVSEIDWSTVKPEDIKSASDIARYSSGKVSAGSEQKYSGVKENAEAKIDRQNAQSLMSGKIADAMKQAGIEYRKLGNMVLFKQAGKKMNSNDARIAIRDAVKARKTDASGANVAWDSSDDVVFNNAWNMYEGLK